MGTDRQLDFVRNQGPFRRQFLITPDDEDVLDPPSCGLRVYNSDAAAKQLSIVPFGNAVDDDPVTLDIPPGMVVFEPSVVAQVLDTGTDVAELVIHGYRS